jgi:hypothetical protein
MTATILAQMHTQWQQQHGTNIKICNIAKLITLRWHTCSGSDISFWKSLRSLHLIYVEFGWSAAWWLAPIVVLWPETSSTILGCNCLDLSIALGPKCNCTMHKHGIVYSCNGTSTHFISMSRSSMPVYVWWQQNQLVETTNQAVNYLEAAHCYCSACFTFIFRCSKKKPSI